MKKLAVVVPVYNEEDNIEEFYKRISAVLAQEAYTYQLIFIDDGSTDASARVLAKITAEDEHVEAFLLSRNYGHQLALTCGIDHADGDCLITMDGDLQHPPELLPQMLRLWEEGVEIVKTRRLATQDANYWKNFSSRCYYKIINKLSTVAIMPGGSDFRLLDAKAVAALRQFRERTRFLRGLVNSMGFKCATLDFVAPSRFAGHSKFTLSKMLHFALDGITAFSNLPLRWAFYLGLIFGVSSFLLLGHVLYVKYIINDAVPGWSTIVACLLFLGGVQLMGIGVLGEYIGRIFEEVKHRPLYIVARHLRK